ncbi:MAG: 50S ribosomal protein L35 [Phycisphaerae bacterium]|nr:50S ribosomal protein L35 [Phycisphaerae bacterium]
MPKMKTHKGLTKRFKVTARGKVKHRRPGKSHLLSVKTGKRKRRLRKPLVVSLKAFTKKFRRMMGK